MQKCVFHGNSYFPCSLYHIIKTVSEYKVTTNNNDKEITAETLLEQRFLEGLLGLKASVCTVI